MGMEAFTMTFREKQQAVLEHLIAERAAIVVNGSTAWSWRLDTKIAELQAAYEAANEHA